MKETTPVLQKSHVQTVYIASLIFNFQQATANDYQQ